MKILGLTGSIGMGKSTAAKMLRRLGVPVHDADATVHALMGPGGIALAAIQAAFPGVVGPNGVDRAELGRRVFGQPDQLRRLESILHPLVRQAERRFVQRHRRRRTPLLALDVPLLFETGGQKRCDRVAVVWCPDFLQTQRVLRRPGASLDRLAAIRRQQMPIREKLKRADWSVPTGCGLAVTFAALRRIVSKLRTQSHA